MKKRFLLPIVLLVSIMNTALTPSAVVGQQTYRLPPQEVVDIVDAAPVPRVGISPDRNWILLLERNALPSIADLSRRKLRLAGRRIDPAANAPFTTGFYRGVALRPRAGEDPVSVPLPAGARISDVSWSHHSDRFALSTITDEGQQLWVVDVEDPTNPRMLTDRLSTVMGGFSWMPDGNALLCQTVPEDRGPEPSRNPVPVGPNIQESTGNMSPTRTYQDLLTNADDEALFEHYARNQLTLLGLDGSVRAIGEPEIFYSTEISPSGEFILVNTVQKPFSYLMTVGSFPQDIEVWDLTGNPVYTVANVPMAENIPIEGVRTGPRRVTWMTGEPARLVWTEALDGGDPNVEAAFRDRLVTLPAPFKAEPEELLKTEHRAFGISSMADPAQVVVLDYDRDRRWIRTRLYNLTDPDSEPRTLMDRSIRDRYNDPGSIVMVPDESGHSRALQDGDWVYRTGQGASPKGNLPFVDRQNLETLETQRLWQCEEGAYETPVAVINHGGGRAPAIVTSRESETEPPNFWLRDLENDSAVALTEFPDPVPQIRGIRKELVKYQRADGVDLSATLYLPADYEEGQRLPLLVWAYPREFNDASTAGQIAGSPSRFVQMGGITHLTLLTQGYAIMDAATMPVIGDPETMNDTFIRQIVDSAAAAIDKAVEMGVADRDRVAVGGHSYGAFMTANLLAHCDLFRAGIARSGAYNRTLTPFGFQSERRAFWDAKDVYFNISPFMHAANIKDPVLLIHGEADNNSGTFPMQSRRMYQAIKGNGGTVRLVMLPNESHGYRARESVMHTQAEMIDWLDQHVKNAGPRPPTATDPDGSNR